MEFPEIATGVLIYDQKDKIFLGTGKHGIKVGNTYITLTISPTCEGFPDTLMVCEKLENEIPKEEPQEPKKAESVVQEENITDSSENKKNIFFDRVSDFQWNVFEF